MFYIIIPKSIKKIKFYQNFSLNQSKFRPKNLDNNYVSCYFYHSENSNDRRENREIIIECSVLCG